MRFFLVILTIMSLICSTIVSLLYLADIAQADNREELFLVRVISIDEAKNQMSLEIVDQKQNDSNEKQTNGNKNQSGVNAKQTDGNKNQSGSNAKQNNGDKNQNDKDSNIDDPIIYSFDSVPESVKKGDIIRIWGTIKNNVSMDTTRFDKTGFENRGKVSVIKGKIAGISNRTGDDPTGVRKRLKRRGGLHPQTLKGGGRGQP